MTEAVRFQPTRRSAGRSRSDTSFMGADEIASVRAFHRSIPQHRVTELRRLDTLAQELDLAAVAIKDESTRFGLGAFKGLGGIYAMARCLAEHLELDVDVGFPHLCQLAGERLGDSTTFVTATAGNHGRGVAWAARQFGCRAVVVIPSDAEPRRLQAIRNEGARVELVDGGFDESLGEARRLAERNGWHLLQDTAWEGYERVPLWVLQGYGTMVAEALEQISAEGLEPPTHLFLQVGVGSFAAAVTAHLAAVLPYRLPRVFTAEPAGAAALFASVEADRRTRLASCEPTTMVCLACTETSTQAWPILRDWCSGHFACSDEITELGREVLATPRGDDLEVLSGTSGALGAGLLTALCTRPELEALRGRLGLGHDSTVLLFSTEGA